MISDVMTYEGELFTYEYSKEPKQYYIECMDTHARFIVFKDEQNKCWFTTFDNTRVSGLHGAIRHYEAVVQNAWQTAFKAANAKQVLS